VLMRSCFLVAAQEGDAHPLGALPVGTLINNVESEPGRGAQYIRAAGMGTKATHIPQLG
jgi:ribosomal protein L2